MIESHGTTKIDASGAVSVTGLVASNFKSQDEAVLTHLGWVVDCLQNEASKLLSKSADDDTGSAI